MTLAAVAAAALEMVVGTVPRRPPRVRVHRAVRLPTEMRTVVFRPCSLSIPTPTRSTISMPTLPAITTVWPITVAGALGTCRRRKVNWLALSAAAMRTVTLDSTCRITRGRITPICRPSCILRTTPIAVTRPRGRTVSRCVWRSAGG
jgi:hypothetical protein